MKMIILISASVMLVLTALLSWKAYADINTYNPMKSPGDFYSLSCKTLDGEDFQFEQLKGKRVLIVNTASKCGFTKQYEGLQNLHETYSEDGFVILGFPCNDFANQESGSEKEVFFFQSHLAAISFS